MSDFSNFSDEFGSSGSEYEDCSIDDYKLDDYSDVDIEENVDSLTSKNSIPWSSSKPSATKTLAGNIMNSIPGAMTYAILKIKTFIDYFLIFFSAEICASEIKYTNLFGANYFKEEWSDMDEIEFKGYLGILILMGTHKDRQEPFCELFSVSEGREIYRQLF